MAQPQDGAESGAEELQCCEPRARQRVQPHACEALPEAAGHHEAEGVRRPGQGQQDAVRHRQGHEDAVWSQQALRALPVWREDHLQHQASVCSWVGFQQSTRTVRQAGTLTHIQASRLESGPLTNRTNGSVYSVPATNSHSATGELAVAAAVAAEAAAEHCRRLAGAGLKTPPAALCRACRRARRVGGTAGCPSHADRGCHRLKVVHVQITCCLGKGTACAGGVCAIRK